MPWMEILLACGGIIVALVSIVVKSQDTRIRDLESFQDRVHLHWEEDAKTYLLKKDFSSFAKDIKDALVRIEDKIEKLRS